MATFSFIILILLSLMGYSGGAVAGAGKNTDLKPQALDLILVIMILIGAIYSRIAYGLNKWFLILIWLTISSALGLLAKPFRKYPKDAKIRQAAEDKDVSNIFKKLWLKWSNFSRRMGSFQSRILLSLMFFLIVSPFAVAVRVFSDPLKIKRCSKGSFWQPRKEVPLDLQQYRRQS
jgi:hypothetical protein